MLNIISLTALRKKVTWPGKVVKNLMKWLDILGYPYVLNQDFNSTQRLWIHDDFFALKKLSLLKEETKLIVGPNLYALPRNIPQSIFIEKYPHIMPAPWVVDFWKHFWYRGILDSWPVWIDTEQFTPSSEEKTKVVIYFKQRREEDLEQVQKILDTQKINYICIRYGSYSESLFQEALRSAKYVIWIGGSESQGIAFAEILSCNIPILVWDISSLRQSIFPGASFIEDELDYLWVTSAPYFDDSCGIRIFHASELPYSIGKMEVWYSQFSPREYVLRNLSLDGQAKKFLELYEKHFQLSFQDGFDEVLSIQKSFRNNLLIEKLFDVYDSSFWVKARKILKK